jgi:4-amino-4-deoxy-L-arabinose transferase-like glycosyltransferase
LTQTLNHDEPPTEIVDAKTSRLSIVLILVAFLLLAFAYSVVNPLHEATDELRHYRFVRTIATFGQLPVQGQEPCRSQSHHPPLFYGLGALATAWIDTGRDICYDPPGNPFWAYRYWEVGQDNKNQYLHGPDEAFPWSGEALAVHIVRAINVLLGAGVVLLTWATGRAIWPRRTEIALGAAALVAFNPMFLYMTGSINNDVIAALSGAAITYACIRLLNNPKGLNWRWGLLLGGLYALALMSKFNLAVVIVLIEAAITWVAWRQRQWRQWLIVNLLIFFIAGLLAGWWFVRNQLLFGEPTGFQELTELWGARDPRESFGLAISELPYAWTTLWGRFGFGQIPLPQGIYNGLLLVTAAGLIGTVIGFIRQASFQERVSLTFLTTNVLLFFLVLFNYMLVSPAGPNGRFFFPALTALALLIIYGLIQWALLIVDLWPSVSGHPRVKAQYSRTASRLVTLVTISGFLVLSLVALFGYLAPAYARPAELPIGAVVPNPVNARLDSLVTLLGYDLSTTTLRPGEPLDLDLYWEVNAQPPGDYYLFVHLMDETGTMVAQRDTHPGLGNFPASQWRPGDRFVDSIRVYIPETAYSPATTTLSIGLYAPNAYRLGIIDENGESLGDTLILDSLQIVPFEGDYPNVQNQNFNDEIRLVGYEYSQHVVGPGESMTVTLYWEALQDVNVDYIVQVRLLGQDGQSWASADSQPQKGDSPTNTWARGQIIADTHVLTIDSNTPAGTYPIEVALLDTESGHRQNIVADDGHWIDSRLLLAQVQVR